MDRKQAVLAAADHIEQHPETYNFMLFDRPKSETDKSCILGWIGFYLGLLDDEDDEPSYTELVAEQFQDVLPNTRGVPYDLVFYETIAVSVKDIPNIKIRNLFWDNTLEIAKAMRVFAEAL